MSRAHAPRIQDASAAASRAQSLIDSGMAIEAYDPVTDEHFRWAPDPSLIANWLNVGSAGNEVTVAVDESRLGVYLEDREASLGGTRGFDPAQAARAAHASLARQSAGILRVRYEPTQHAAEAGETLQTIA